VADTLELPRHIGFIVDGNRRWAKEHGLPTYEGHLAGYNALKDIIISTINQGVKYVTFYTFSTENWKRAADEVGSLMKLVMRLCTSDVATLIKEDIRLLVLGNRDGLPSGMSDAIIQAEARTAECKKGTMILCFNYGGQQEIVEATRRLIQDGVEPDVINPALFEKYLYQPEVPQVDLIVRTSGEKRLSNFMLWRAAYSELIFLEKFWPDMRESDVLGILEEYTNRQRRFGA
jgi:undecaprenyl diphosphate synthase